jgi:hypothetical protein
MKKQGRFKLQVAVDFHDDLMSSHFTKKTFREMMRIFRSWDITRIYWIGYPNDSGWWNWSPYPQVIRNIRRTYDEVGDFTAAAVRYAHEQGIEVFQEFKPFDLATVALMPDAFYMGKKKRGPRGIRALGGVRPWSADFLVDHPEYLIARNMAGLDRDPRTQIIGSIRLIKNDAAATRLKPNTLRLWVSDDNLHYRPYQGSYRFKEKVVTRPEVIRGLNFNRPGGKKETVRVIALEGLRITEPFVAVANTFADNTHADFQNYYYKLVELYDEHGQEIPFSYGLDNARSASWWHHDIRWRKFPERGFVFDCSGDGTNHPGYNMIEAIGALDVSGQALGLAKGKNSCLPALCPAYHEVRRYWLDMIRQFIGYGVDGVELRCACHLDTTDWNAYGFNQPVVDAYKRRYGVDIRNETLDIAKWRKLRGEYYTLFYREAQKLLHQTGKIMQVDVGNENYADPALPQMLNIHADWKAWLKFADAVTLKNTINDKDIYHDVLRTAAKAGIPAYLSSFASLLTNKNRTRIVDLFLRRIQADGTSGLILYESGQLMEARPDGTFDIRVPELAQIVVPFLKTCG